MMASLKAQTSCLYYLSSHLKNRFVILTRLLMTYYNPIASVIPNENQPLKDPDDFLSSYIPERTETPGVLKIVLF